MQAPTRPRVWALDARPAEPAQHAQPAELLGQPNQPGPTRLAQIQEQLRLIQEENAKLKARLSAVEEKLAGEQTPPASTQPHPCPAEEQDQTEPSRLEAWLRRNPAWLDEPCPFKKATGRTWRQIAGDEGDKIPMNGKGPQVPRAYLHSIESWAAASETIRLKAELALALCGNEAGQ